jgi:two-component system, chemotaxis family, protein-glutamate methylesterase/glutaminase
MHGTYSNREQSLAVKERTPEFSAVVIGGSAGALDPLRRLVADIPPDFSAAIFVANHVPPDSVSALPHILTRSGALFATHAIDQAPVSPGRIIVAPPDHHLTLQDGVMRVDQGPLENNHRPSIDVLFRSAAISFKSAVCAILLSGTLDDGAAGIVAVHEAGGATFVQAPEEAQFPDMPLNAIATRAVDGVYPVKKLFDAVCRWLSQPSRGKFMNLPSSVKRRRLKPISSGFNWKLDVGR